MTRKFITTSQTTDIQTRQILGPTLHFPLLSTRLSQRQDWKRVHYYRQIIHSHYLHLGASNQSMAPQKKYSYTSKSKNFKNLSFVSNESTNYDSENLTLNSYRLNTQINNLPEPAVNTSVFLNQSLNISGNVSSRRNTYENIKNQEYASFLNEWKNMHFYHKNNNTQENNGECLNIVPEETNEENAVHNEE